MKPIHLYKNDAYVTYEKSNGWYVVRLWDCAGNLSDKVRCDSYREACAYHRSFKAIARGM